MKLLQAFFFRKAKAMPSPFSSMELLLQIDKDIEKTYGSPSAKDYIALQALLLSIFPLPD